MTIKVINANTLEERHACWGYSPSIETTYNVLAIKKLHKKMQYLVEYDSRLNWWDADLFNVIEDTIPKEWIEIKYKYFYKLKNKKYDFNIPITYFCGPKEFLDNEDFLFDIYENPYDAYFFYKSYYINALAPNNKDD